MLLVISLMHQNLGSCYLDPEISSLELPNMYIPSQKVIPKHKVVSLIDPA